MAYTPRTWQTGDLITAAELNAIEQAASAAAVAADIGTSGTPTGDAVKAVLALPVVGGYTYNTDGTVASGPAGETYAYNTDGTVHSVTLNGVTRTYSYDATGNVTGVA